MAKLSVFISHVEEDQALALEIARGLEGAGFTTWYYERDSEPGISYLLQVHTAIEQCDAVVVLISPDSVRSYQVTKEIVRAHETGKAFIPVRYNIAHAEFQQRQPEWNIAIGAAASIPVTLDGIATIIPRIARGLQQMSSSGSERASRSSDQQGKPQSGSSGGDAASAYEHQAPKARTGFQRQQPADTPGRSGGVDAGSGYGLIGRVDKKAQIAAGILGGVVVIGVGIYLSRGPQVAEPVSPQISQTNAMRSPQAAEPTSPVVVPSNVDPPANPSMQSLDPAVAKLPTAKLAPPSTIAKQSPQSSARSSAPALVPGTPRGEPQQQASKREPTRDIDAARQESQKRGQLQMETALGNVDEGLRSIEEAALQKPQDEDPTVLQQMKERRRRVEDTKQKLKAASDFETREQLLKELHTRLAELENTLKQVKAVPRRLKI
jgi:hypothetical protein